MKKLHPRLEVSSDGVRLMPDPKPRICMGCGIKFLSEGPWNRICGACGSKNSKLGKAAAHMRCDPTIKPYLTGEDHNP